MRFKAPGNRTPLKKYNLFQTLLVKIDCWHSSGTIINYLFLQSCLPRSDRVRYTLPQAQH